jgi:hypothetical protein
MKFYLWFREIRGEKKKKNSRITWEISNPIVYCVSAMGETIFSETLHGLFSLFNFGF